jgi:EAL domain-containing protein (putative c-di-GMP-specific phosphodiesterase class I)
MSRSADDRFFVRTMIDLAKHLGLKVVAEWVQDETTARLLSEWGCDYLQGALCGMGTLELPLSTDSEVRVAV